MTPKIQGETLTYQQDNDEHTLTVGTTAWFAWLETASTFSFVSDLGTFTARKEQAGHKRGGWYWKAYRKQQGKLFSLYLGKSETLTLVRLYAVAQALADSRGSSEAAGQRSPEFNSNQAADFPPLRTDENRLQSLPAQLTTLIGREQEISAISGLLQREEVRLVTLTGTGGIGKTRLGIEVASRLLDTFADGVAFVSLAPLIHPSLVLHTIAHTLGLAK